MREYFWTFPLEDLSTEEWEALCDGCGKCCLIKLEDEDTGQIAFTTLVCKLFENKTCQCSNYQNRFAFVDDCLTLDMKSIPAAEHWLPKTCAYVLRFHNQPLPLWHHLITGSMNTMHNDGHSVKGQTTSEEVMGELDDAIEYINWELGP